MQDEKGTQVVQFNDWCRSAIAEIGNHGLCLLTAEPAELATGIEATAAVVPGHYASEEQVSRALARLGKSAAAALVQGKLPTSKGMRSGDLGEIYATEWIDAHSGGYFAPVKRLRWKDHRNMAMRGDDVIAIRLDPQSQRLRFLKTEAKSRVRLTGQVLADARTGLDKHGGLPSAHALSFIGLLPLLPVTPDVDRPSTFPARFLDRAGRCAGAFGLGEVGFECCQAGWGPALGPD